jgi:hypothetical protein
MPEYVENRRISLKHQPGFNEAWLQQRIATEPGLLGLGELDVKDQERPQPGAGRLDMLLFDAETNTRYEVELQLGSTNESHIIRTIEYWDIERRRYPQYEHVAVIVAEQITGRFLNVISLFNGSIPLIAVQLNAIEVGDKITLVFTTVLDLMPLGLEEEDETEEPRDRAYWERKASAAMLELTDDLLGLVRDVEPGVTLKYNKNYVGLARDGVATNFVTFRPRKEHVLAEFKIPRTEELTQQIQDAGIELLTYNPRRGRYRMQVTRSNINEHAEVLRDLARQARVHYGPE